MTSLRHVIARAQRRPALIALLLLAGVLLAQPASAASPRPGPAPPGGSPSVASVLQSWGFPGSAVQAASAATAAASAPVARNFKLLGHTDLGASDTNGDVWVLGNFAYVGTWADPCDGLGAKIVDASKLRAPKLIGRFAARDGTSAEDIEVRHVSTKFFTGDLAAVGIQRCGSDPALDSQQFGLDLWDLTDPFHPVKLAFLGVTNGGGGVHELDLFQRGKKVYALLATPFSEWFDPVPGGDFRIVDVTNPRAPVQVGQWGAGAHGLSVGPFFGIGSFGASFDHSARASDDGSKAYVSYWDLGVLTLDISDVTNPVLVGQTKYPADADGDTHSVSIYPTGKRPFLLVNDEDFDPTSPTHILFGPGGSGIGQFSPSGPAVWELPGHSLRARVVKADNEGCSTSDYPKRTPGRIAVVRTPFPFFDPGGGAPPLCLQAEQEAAAAAAGAVAVVHDFISTATSPQWFDIGSVGIPVLFTDHATAKGMLDAGAATLDGQRPSWGFMRVFDASTGRQVAKFDGLPHVHDVTPPAGAFSIHNNEVLGHHSYASWYTNGVVELDLTPLPDDPRLVGQFLPAGAPSHSAQIPGNVPIVWGVAIRPPAGDEDEPTVFLSDMNSGLWIVRPTD
jgi:hypothetical protein